jgi:phospholipid-binding lipoprotein MlaA
MLNKINAIITAILLAIAITGCSTVSNKDPLEGFNRGVYKFNDVADKAVFKPVAGAYKAVTPSPVRTGVNNFFANLNTVITTFNQVLQFKFGKAAESAGRFVINSTVGIFGLIDVASIDAIKKHDEDFGQTLAYWGVSDGAYLVLPIIGPSTTRDAGGLLVDTFGFNPIGYVKNPRSRNVLLGMKIIDKRAELLPGSDLLDEAALDPYAFMRDAYFQRRHHQINDGTDEKNDDGFEADDEPSK